MKRLLYLYIFTLIIGLYSCKKNATVTNSTGLQPKLQFYANGTLINLDAIADVNLGWTQYPLIGNLREGNISFFTLGSRRKSPSDGINLGIALSSILSVQSYPQNIDTGDNITENGTTGKNTDCYILGVKYNAGSTQLDGTYTITITSITNNLVSGTFYGNLIPFYSGNPNLVITNGTFSNLPIQ